MHALKRARQQRAFENDRLPIYYILRIRNSDVHPSLGSYVPSCGPNAPCFLRVPTAVHVTSEVTVYNRPANVSTGHHNEESRRNHNCAGELMEVYLASPFLLFLGHSSFPFSCHSLRLTSLWRVKSGSRCLFDWKQSAKRFDRDHAAFEPRMTDVSILSFVWCITY